MTHEELERRRPVWAAMSELFLDTEVRWYVPTVARHCAESKYDDEQLERIFWAEVFPEAIGNMLQVAGDWAMVTLDEEALIKRANHGSIPWLKRRAHGWMVEKTWLATREVTGWLRDLPTEEQLIRARALDLLGHRYFEAPEKQSLVATPERVDEVLDVAREEWKRYEPVCQRLLIEGAEPKSAGRASQEVRRLLKYSQSPVLLETSSDEVRSKR